MCCQYIFNVLILKLPVINYALNVIFVHYQCVKTFRLTPSIYYRCAITPLPTINCAIAVLSTCYQFVLNLRHAPQTDQTKPNLVQNETNNPERHQMNRNKPHNAKRAAAIQTEPSPSMSKMKISDDCATGWPNTPKR